MKHLIYISIIFNFIYANLVINEIHYNPDQTLEGPDSNFEFIEIFNNSNHEINLDGYSIYTVTYWGWWSDHDLLVEFDHNHTITPFSYEIISFLNLLSLNTLFPINLIFFIKAFFPNFIL